MWYFCWRFLWRFLSRKWNWSSIGVAFARSEAAANLVRFRIGAASSNHQRYFQVAFPKVNGFESTRTLCKFGIAFYTFVTNSLGLILRNIWNYRVFKRGWNDWEAAVSTTTIVFSLPGLFLLYSFKYSHCKWAKSIAMNADAVFSVWNATEPI